MTFDAEALDQVRRSVARAESTLRELLAADLAGEPVYIVLASDCPEGTFNPGNYACVHPRMTSVLRPYIGDRWAGRGPTIYMDDRQIVENASRRADIGAIVNGLAAHEGAHLIEFVADGRDRWRREDPADTEMLAATAGAFKMAEELDENEPPWVYHESRFLRLALHLAFRLSARACYCPPSLAFNTFDYGLSNPAGHFMAALEAEAVRTQGVRLIEILAQPAPRAYADLWDRDIQRFHDATRKRKEQTMFEVIQRLMRATEVNAVNAESAYKKLAMRIADGKEAKGKEEVMVAILRDAGKTVEELKTLVELIAKRRGLAETLKRAADAKERQAEIDRKWNEADVAFDEAEKRRDEARSPLLYEQQQLDQQIKAATAAEQELLRTAADLGLKAAVSAAQANYASERTRVQGMVDHLARTLEPAINDAEIILRRQQNGPIGPSGQAHCNSEDFAIWENMKAKREKMVAEIASIRASLPELERKVTEAQQALLDPHAV